MLIDLTAANVVIEAPSACSAAISNGFWAAPQLPPEYGTDPQREVMSAGARRRLQALVRWPTQLLHRRQTSRSSYTGAAMTKLIIEVPDEVAGRVADAAAQRGVAPEELVGQVVSETFPPRPRLGFIGLGHSGRADLSETVKELRREVAEEMLADDRRSGEG